MNKAIVVAALLGAAGAAWLAHEWQARGDAAKSNSDSSTRSPAIPVSLGKVEVADVPVAQIGLGTVRALNSAVVTSRIDGQIVKVNFREGEMVHTGEILAEVDPRPYRAILAQAQATQLKDQAQLDSARLDLDRAQRLAATGSGTTKQLDVARSLVASFEASVKADAAAIEAAQVQLDFCSIRAPFDGRAGARLLDVGNNVRAGTPAPIVMINQIKPAVVEFSLVADTIPLIRSRMATSPIDVIAADRNDVVLGHGRLAVLDNQVSTGTGTVRYRAMFDNTDEALWPGQFVNVRVQIDVLRGVLTLPLSAIVRDDGGPYVFTVDDQSVAKKRRIALGATTASLAVVENGLVAGDTVVVDGQYRILSGSKVANAQRPASASR